MFCTNCGAKKIGQNRFCTVCGKPFNVDEKQNHSQSINTNESVINHNAFPVNDMVLRQNHRYENPLNSAPQPYINGEDPSCMIQQQNYQPPQGFYPKQQQNYQSQQRFYPMQQQNYSQNSSNYVMPVAVPYMPYVPTPANGLAIAGFICALTCMFWFLGLIFSICGLVTSFRLRGSGRGFAIAGLIISIITIAPFIALMAWLI